MLDKGAQYGHSFVSRSQTAIICSENLQNTLQSELLTFFNCLTTVGAEFGFRTALEMVRFVGFYIELSGTHQIPVTEPIDFVILQKLLPKLHGSRTKLAPVLKQLWYLCTTPVDSRNLIDNGTVLHNNSQANSISDPSSVVPSDAPYPESAEKISRMWKLLHANGFTSFAEA
jgi:5-methylcytosine-specific restriction protein B